MKKLAVLFVLCLFIPAVSAIGFSDVVNGFAGFLKSGATGFATADSDIGVSTAPDLEITSITFSTSSPSAGQSFGVGASVKNKGTAAAASYAVNFDLGAGGSIVSFPGTNLAAGATTPIYWATATYSSAGTYTVKVSVSASDDADLSNNELTKPVTVAVTCSDTDSGVDIYAQGTCSDANGRVYTDKCYDSTKVYEYGCSSGACASYGTKACPEGYSCTDGACVQGAEQKPDLTIYSFTVSPESTFVGETITVNAVIKNIGNAAADDYSYTIDFGTYAGGSAGPVSLAAGESKAVSTTATYSSTGTYTIKLSASATNDANTADNTATKTVKVSERTCMDTDGGRNVTFKGTCTAAGKTYTDSCYSIDKVREYICSSSSDICAEVGAITCPSGTYCSDGACVVGTAQDTPDLSITNLVLSTSSIVVGKPVELTITVKNVGKAAADSYALDVECGSVIEEEITQYGALAAGKIAVLKKSCTYSTSGQKSLRVAVSAANDASAGNNEKKMTLNVAVPKCVDTDGGTDETVKGTCTDGKRTYTDKCYDSTKVYEYGCSPTLDICSSFGTKKCPAGTTCQEGACVAPPVVVCTDSDYGLNYSVKGYIINANNEQKYDYCEDPATNNILVEMVCNDFYDYVTYDCPYGCADGACNDAIVDESVEIQDEQIFKVSKGGYSRKLQLKEVLHGVSASDNYGTIKLRDIITGAITEWTYIDLKGNLIFDGNTYAFKVTADSGAANLNVDLNGDGVIGEINCASHELSITEVSNSAGKVKVSYSTKGAASNVKVQMEIATETNASFGAGGGGKSAATKASVATNTSSGGGGGGTGRGGINCGIISEACSAGSYSSVSCTVSTDCNYPSFEPNKRYFVIVTDKSCPSVSEQVEIIEQEPVEGGGGVCEMKKVESGSNKLNINEYVDSVLPSVGSADLPDTLQSGSITNEYGNFSYTQRLNMPDSARVQLAADPDDPYAEARPYLVFARGGNGYFYKLKFSPALVVNRNDGGVLSGLVNKEIELLGKPYEVISATASAYAIDLSLIEMAVEDWLAEGDTNTYDVSGKSYKVTIDYAGSTGTKLTINNEITALLRKGDAYRLSDGMYIAVTSIVTSETAGGLRSVNFILGKNKIGITDPDTTSSHNGYLTFNGVDLVAVRADIFANPVTQISEINIWYSPSEKVYVDPDSKASVKADEVEAQKGTFLNSIDFLYPDLNVPSIEIIELAPSDAHNYKLLFTNKAGLVYDIGAFAFNTNSSVTPKYIFNGRFDGDAQYVLHLYEGWVKNDEAFVVSKDGYSRVLQFKEVQPGENRLDNVGFVKFKDLGNGDIYEVAYSNLQGALAFDGNTYKFKVSSDSSSALVIVDMNGQGSYNLVGPIPIYTKYGHNITLKNNEMIVSVNTQGEVQPETITAAFKLDPAGALDMQDDVTVKGSYPASSMIQEWDGSFIYYSLSGFGAVVKMDRRSYYAQNILSIDVPSSAVTANVYVSSTACDQTSSSDEESPLETSCRPIECDDDSLVDCYISGESCICEACPEQPAVECSDTDQGENIFVKGVASGISWGTTSTYVSEPDYCIESGEKAGRLAEFHCRDNFVTSTSYECPVDYDCINGACAAQQSEQVCTDSDGGLDYYAKGTTTDKSTTKTDNCHSDGITLAEYYCDGSKAEQINFKCPSRCLDGACVKEETAAPPEQPKPLVEIVSPTKGSVQEKDFVVVARYHENLSDCYYFILDAGTGLNSGFQQVWCGSQLGFVVSVGQNGSCATVGKDTCNIIVGGKNKATDAYVKDEAYYSISSPQQSAFARFMRSILAIFS